MLPNLIIIGAMKSGTTSLHKYLDLHPQLQMAEKKELNFFTRDHNWHRGLEWYRSQFPHCTRVAGEASTNYSKFPAFRGVPETMHGVIPHAKIVYIVRDPVDRIVSHYLHNVRAKREQRTLSEALRNPQYSHYVNCSRYFMQLERYLMYYPRSQIKVTTLEDLSGRPRQTMSDLFRFLGVDPSFWDDRFLRTHNAAVDDTALGSQMKRLPGVGLIARWVPLVTRQRIDRPAPSGPLRKPLVEMLGTDIEKLRAFTARSFSDWSV